MMTSRVVRCPAGTACHPEVVRIRESILLGRWSSAQAADGVGRRSYCRRGVRFEVDRYFALHFDPASDRASDTASDPDLVEALARQLAQACRDDLKPLQHELSFERAVHGEGEVAAAQGELETSSAGLASDIDEIDRRSGHEALREFTILREDLHVAVESPGWNKNPRHVGEVGRGLMVPGAVEADHAAFALEGGR